MAIKRKHKSVDLIDAEQLENMLTSNAWDLVRRRIEGILRKKTSELAQDLDQIKTARLRGYLEALQLAAQTPAILIREAREPRAPKKTDE